MDRSINIRKIETNSQGWDIIVIGGGATGLGIAMDASKRGFHVLLLEQADFAKGTSSRSTKLVHGGVRYLAQGNIGLVLEALHERGLLIKNAPHVVHNLSFIIPCYKWGQQAFYSIGLKLYDLLSGRLGLGKSVSISKKETIESLPTLRQDKLKGGVIYHDGQFDDARLAINIAQTAEEHGGIVLNYIKVINLLKNEAGKITGVMATDAETDKTYSLYAKSVINATGIFVDEILKLDNPHQNDMVMPSQGVHLVFDKIFLKSDRAIMIPKTQDGRVLFVVPWHGKALVGTTDTPIKLHSLEPRALSEEIEFILKTAGTYLTHIPTRNDVLSIFAGLRPLAAPEKDTGATKEISRGHKIIVADSGLITITGGKWTTFRKMAEDTVNKTIKITELPFLKCTTKNLKIHGYRKDVIPEKDIFQIYGSDEMAIRELITKNPALAEPIFPQNNSIKAQVVWAVREEMARTIEDVLARRLRILFLDAKMAIDMAPSVSEIMAAELNKESQWQQQQLDEFVNLANNYLLTPYFPSWYDIKKQSL
ncbi:MAG: glycerol-3-phosphate dehydrogenase/oxidase [Bacteroidota bacterium]|nr:glycerol-3-phosphate dehydrogenase/oxidase [Bacteroidota bacterium]